MALDPAPNNKKVIAGATLEKMKKLINIDITLNHNEEHHKGKGSKLEKKLLFLWGFVHNRPLVH